MEFPFSRTFGAGTHELGSTDINVLADTTDGAVNFILPSIASAIESSARQGYGIGNIGNGTFSINITDIGNNASVNNITVTANASDKFNGDVSLITITQNKGGVSIKPTANNIWNIVQGSSSSSGGALPFGNDTGVSDAYQVAIVGATLTDGYLFEVRIANTNTGASTLQVNALGVKPLVDTDLNPLEADDIEDNSIYLISYNFAVDSYQVMGLAKLSTSIAFPIVRYVYLVQDASDAVRMGGTADNVYTTAQTAYDAAVALRALNGGIVVIKIGNITQALSGDITLTADLSNQIKFEGISKDVSFIRDIISNGFAVNISGNNFRMRNITTTPTAAGDGGGVTFFTLSDVIIGNVTTSASNLGVNKGGDVSATSWNSVNIGTITTSGSTLGGNGGLVSFATLTGVSIGSIVTNSPLNTGGSVSINFMYATIVNSINTSSSDTGIGGAINISTPFGVSKITTITANGGSNGNGNGGQIFITGNDGSAYIYGTSITSNGAGTGNGGVITLSYCKGYAVTSNGGAAGGNAGNISLTYCHTSTTGAATQIHYGAGSPTLNLTNSQVFTVVQNNQSAANFGAVTLKNSIIITSYTKTKGSTGGFGNYIISDTSSLNMNIPSVAIDGMTVINLTESVWANAVITRNVNIASATPETITSVSGIQGGGLSANYIIRFTNTGVNPVTFDAATINTKTGLNVVLQTGDWIEIFNNNEYNSSLSSVLTNTLIAETIPFVIADWVGNVLTITVTSVTFVQGFTLLDSTNQVLVTDPTISNYNATIVGNVITITLAFGSPIDGTVRAFGYN